NLTQSLVQADHVRSLLLMCKNFLTCMFESASCIGSGVETRSTGSEYILCFLFGCFDVVADLPPVCLIVIGNHIRISHADSLNSEDACHLLFVDEIRIAELFKPVEVVKNRMIDAVVSG